MKQMYRNIYILICAVAAVTITVMEVQPALFFINVLAPNPGDEYSVTLVLLIIYFLFLSPLILLLVVLRLLRKPLNEASHANKTGLFVSRQRSWASSLIAIPIYVDSKKVGVVDNGEKAFFETSSGMFTIHAGKGKQASEKIEVKISNGEQVKLELRMNTKGLFPTIELKQVNE